MTKSFNNSQATEYIYKPIGIVDNFSIACSAAANNLTITINDAAGNAPSNASPIIGYFRHSTLTDGTTVRRTSNTALTFTINDTNIMGTLTNVPFRLHLVLFDNAGTMVLGAINCIDLTVSGGSTVAPLLKIMPGALQTSASGTNGGAAALTYYASVSALTSKAVAYLGFIESNSISFTAGKWGSSGTGLISRVVKCHPGMPMPGDVIQERKMQDGTGAQSTTSSTFQSTNTTLSITPQSICALFEIRCFGTGYTTANTTRVISRLHNSGTALGNESDAYAGSSSSIGAHVHIAFHYPGATSSQTFLVKFCNSDNATTINWNNIQIAGGAMLVVREIST